MQPFVRSGRRALVVVCTIALLAQAIVVGAGATLAGAASMAPTVITQARAASPIAAGAHALVDVSVHNEGESTLAAPITLAVSGLPTGVSVLGADTDLAGRMWDCAGGPECLLVDVAGAAGDLDPFELAQTRVRLAVDPGATLAATETLTVSVDAGVSDPPADLSSASTTVDLERLDPAVPATMEIVSRTDGFVAGQPSSVVVQITNLGPDVIGGAGSEITVDGIIPPGATLWSASGAGWTCVDASGFPACTWTGAERAAGDAIDPLAIDFRSPPDETEPDAPLTWTRSVTHTPASGPAISDVSEQLAHVMADLAPIAAVFVAPEGPAAVERGNAVELVAGMAGSGLDDPWRTVEFSTTMPAGWTFSGATAPWDCAAAGDVLACERSADFDGESESASTITFQTADDAAPGTQLLAFTGSVSGPDVAPPTIAAVSIEVVVVGAPLPQVRLFHFPSPDTPTEVLDGTPLPIAAGASTQLGIDVRNIGSAPVPAGTTLTFAVDAPSGTTVDETGPDWSCATAPVPDGVRVTCTSSLGAAVAPSAASPMAVLSIMAADGSSPGFQSWPLTLSAELDSESVASLGTSASVPVVVGVAAAVEPAIGIDVDIVQQPRVTQPVALVELTVTNAGDATLGKTWSVRIDLPAELRKDEQKSLPKECKYKKGKPAKKDKDAVPPTVTCKTKKELAVGAIAGPHVLPVRVPAEAGDIVVPVVGMADGLDDVTTDFVLRVLPALDATATATPNRVILPEDPADPATIVMLDGRASVSDGATATWTHLAADGDPVVTFVGFEPGVPATGLVARFEPPRVDVETTMQFELRLHDGRSADAVVVEVVVEPAGAPDTDASSPAQARSKTPSSATHAARVGGGSWSWTVDPTISKNDHDPGFDGTIHGSRARVLDHGQFVWNGPGAVPTGISTANEWHECLNDPPEDPPGSGEFPEVCSLVATGDVYIPYDNSYRLESHVTVSGTDEDLNPVSTTNVTNLGSVTFFYNRPFLILPPFVDGSPSVGATVTADTGEWSMELERYNPHQYQWLTCTGPDLGSCSDIPGATDETYEVQPSDSGNALRVEVTVHSIEGDRVTAVSSARRSGVVITCDRTCYEWSVAPSIDRNGIGQPDPVTGFEATLVDDGTFAWTDATAAPDFVTTDVRWFICSVQEPANCAPRGSGRTYTPDTPNFLLEARLTVTGRYAEDGSIREATEVVPFGEIRDRNLPPDATTVPSISGRTLTDDILTADPGVWEHSPSATRTYEWYRCDAVDIDDCTAVGVTTSTYRVVVEDQTERASVMRVDVTAPGYENPGTVRSTPSDVLSGYVKRLITPPSVDPGPDGPRIGVEMTATDAVWSEMPATTDGPHIDWQRCSTSDEASCSPIVVASGPAYTPTDEAEIGGHMRVRSRISGEHPSSPPFEESSHSPVVGPIQAAALVATTDLPGGTASIANGETLVVQGSSQGGRLPISYSWSQTAGDPVVTNPVNGAELRVTAPASGTGVLEFQLTATDADGTTATADISVEYGNTGAPVELCEALNEVRTNLSTKFLHYGDIRLTFGPNSRNSDVCTADTVITIPTAAVWAHDGLVSLTSSATISADGVTIAGGGSVQFRTDSSLDGLALEVPDGASLTVGFAPADGTYELVGAFVGDNLPRSLLDLALPWTGASRIALGDAGGVQTISLGLRVWDNTFGPATPVPGQLPTAPVGSPVVTIEGSISTDKTFTLSIEATGLVSFGGAGLDFSGSVERPDAGADLVFFARGDLTGPATLAEGVVLDHGFLEWNGDTFSGAGGVVATVGGSPLDFDVSFTFTDPNRWSASVTVSGGGTWRPVPGLALSNPVVSGTILRQNAETRFDLDIRADQVVIGSGVVLTSPLFALDGSCVEGESCVYDLEFSTGLDLTIYGSSLAAQMRGTLNTGTGHFSAFASLGTFTIVDGLTVHGASFRVERGDAGLEIEATARVSVLGGVHDLSITIDSRGAIAVISTGTWTPFSGAPTFTNTHLAYSSFTTSTTINGEYVFLIANTLHIAATAGVPDWVEDLIGDSNATATVRGSLTLTPLQFRFTLGFDFGNVEVFDVGGVQLSITGATFTVVAENNQFSTGFSAFGTLVVPGINGTSSTLDVRAGFAFRSNTGTFSGSVSILPGAVWNNALGVPGLKIYSLDIAVGYGLNGGVELGFAGTVGLPDGWGPQIGITDETQISLAASIAGASSCFGLEFSRPYWLRDRTVIDIGGLGALTAEYASFTIAPTGCDIGETHIDAGVALTFDGAIFDVSVEVNVEVETNPFGILATVDIGQIKLADELIVKDTSLRLVISQSEKSIFFAGGVDAFGASATVEGGFSHGGGVTTVEFEGMFSSPNLGGFTLEELSVDFKYTSRPREITVDTTISVDILGQPQTVQLAFRMLNGKVVEASGSADLVIGIGELLIEADGSFEFKQGRFPTITIDGSASLDSHPLTTVSGTLREGYLEFFAELNLGGIFTEAPQLSGAVVWDSKAGQPLPMIKNKDGVEVQASRGDFRFAANNIGLDVSGFRLQSDLLFGRIGNGFFAEVEAHLNFGLAQRSSITVDFAGSFDSDANFSLEGSGVMEIGGVDAVTLDFIVARDGGTATVGAGARIAVPNLGNVTVNGLFTYSQQHGWLYRIEGNLNINIDGHNFGNGEFETYRELVRNAPVTGMRARIAVNIPELVRGDAQLAIHSNGNVNFGAYLATQGDMKDAIGDHNARVEFRHTGAGTDYSFRFSLRNAMKVPGSFTLAGEVNRFGDFIVSATVELGPYTAGADIEICYASASASGSLTVTVSSAPRLGLFSIEVDFSGRGSASCGALSASAGLKGEFKYTAPADFTLKVKASFSLGVKTWTPTLYTG